MPPTLIVEALAQAGGILCFFSGLLKPLAGSTTYLAAIDNTRVERAGVRRRDARPRLPAQAHAARRGPHRRARDGA